MLSMEKRLKTLFDYQRFENTARLANIIAQTEERYGKALSEEELFFVNAAGELNTENKKPLED